MADCFRIFCSDCAAPARCNNFISIEGEYTEIPYRASILSGKTPLFVPASQTFRRIFNHFNMVRFRYFHNRFHIGKISKNMHNDQRFYGFLGQIMDKAVFF